MDEQNPSQIVPTPNPNNPNQQVMQPKHGGVTALGVISTVLGSIALLGSFIPCLGALALYIAIPSIICGIIGIVLANKHKVALALPTVGLVLSAIGGLISGYQWMAINKAANEVDDAFEKASRDIDRIERLYNK